MIFKAKKSHWSRSFTLKKIIAIIDLRDTLRMLALEVKSVKSKNQKVLKVAPQQQIPSYFNSQDILLIFFLKFISIINHKMYNNIISIILITINSLPLQTNINQQQNEKYPQDHTREYHKTDQSRTYWILFLNCRCAFIILKLRIRR